MDFTEPANWARIRSDAEEFVARHVTREVIENERRTGDGADRELTRKLGERGWIAPAWPVEEGGAGLDQFETGCAAGYAAPGRRSDHRARYDDAAGQRDQGRRFR